MKHNTSVPLRYLQNTAIPLLSTLFLAVSNFAADSPLFIPFQGQVTNQAGTIVADGQYSVIFNLYDQAVGGQPIWSERHVKIGVSKGTVNVFLGSISPLTNVDFAQIKYLGITVDTDNLATTADPEMVPRSLIIPAFHAKTAGNSARLAGADWSAIMVDAGGAPTANASAGQISGTRIRPASISSDKLNVGSGLTEAYLGANSVTAAKLADNSVDSAAIIDGQVNTADLATGAVTNAKLSIISGDKIDPLSMHPDRINHDIVVLSDKKALNTDAGIAFKGWQARTLNTVDSSIRGASSAISLSNNTITLQNGTYLLRAQIPAMNCEQFQAVLRDVTGSPASPVIVLTGTNAFARAPTMDKSWIEGILTVTSGPRQYQVWQYSTADGLYTYTLGHRINTDVGPAPHPPSNIYTRVVIERLR